MLERAAIFLILLLTVTLANSQPIDAGSNSDLIVGTARHSQEMTENGELKATSDMLTDWNTAAGGVKWFHNCDFPGHDIRFQWMPIEKCHIKCCSQACIALSECNAFRWNDGWCFLKNVPAASLNRKSVSSGTSGFLPWRFRE